MRSVPLTLTREPSSRLSRRRHVGRRFIFDRSCQFPLLNGEQDEFSLDGLVEVVSNGHQVFRLLGAVDELLRIKSRVPILPGS